jgi:hypothetical protein
MDAHEPLSSSRLWRAMGAWLCAEELAAAKPEGDDERYEHDDEEEDDDDGVKGDAAGGNGLGDRRCTVPRNRTCCCAVVDGGDCAAVRILDSGELSALVISPRYDPSVAHANGIVEMALRS